MSFEEFTQLLAREAADAAKGLRVTAEIGTRSNANFKAGAITWEAV